MALITVNIDGRNWTGELADSSMPLQWMLRDIVGVAAATQGCGRQPCGQCVVLADGIPVRTCSAEVGSFVGRQVVTGDGLADLPAAGASGVTGRMLQEMWSAADAPQCTTCQPGILLSLYALLRNRPRPTDKEIDAAVGGHCSCGSSDRMRRSLRGLTGRDPNRALQS